MVKFILILLISTVVYSKNIHVTTWNIKMLPSICFFFSPNELKQQDQRLDWICEYIKNSDLEIIQLQEVFNDKAIEKIQAKLRSTYPYMILPRGKRFHFKNGLMVLSKHPVKLEKAIFFDAKKLHDAFVSKGAILYSAQIGHESIMLLNTHMQADYPVATSEVVRQEQLLQIYSELIHPYAYLNKPLVMAGDFNFTEYSLEYKFLYDLFPVVDLKAKLQKSYATFNNENYWNRDQKSENLDHIFLFDKNQMVQLVDLNLLKVLKDGVIDYSDHYGLTATFDLQMNLSIAKK